MRTLRRIVAALAIAILALVLSACGPSNDSKDTGKKSEPTARKSTERTTASPAAPSTSKGTATTSHPTSGKLADVCTKVPDTEVSKIIGRAFKGKTSNGSGSNACAYTPKALGPILMLIVFNDTPGHAAWKELTHKLYTPEHFVNVTDATKYKPGSYTILRGDLIIDIQLAPMENPADDAKVKELAQYAVNNL